MDYSFIIRKANEDDAPGIHAVMQESFAKYVKDTGLKGTVEALTETQGAILLDIKNKEVYIALVDGKPVGSIRVEIRDDKTAYISRFGVCPGYRNIGIGKSLINLIDKLLLSKGVKKAYLHTASNYSELVRFYYGRGFYIESVSYDRGYPRALMVKDISKLFSLIL
ncbi:MAG: GNAT family N-acetyltransferase [Eubacteriales bacterium]|nr:GNAT family N-acetyltransferase [Eubacteriales bacterium]